MCMHLWHQSAPGTRNQCRICIALVSIVVVRTYYCVLKLNTSNNSQFVNTGTVCIRGLNCKRMYAILLTATLVLCSANAQGESLI